MPSYVGLTTTGIPRGFRVRIRDCREAAIVGVLVAAQQPMTAGEIGSSIGMSGHEVGRRLRVHSERERCLYLLSC